MKKFVLTAAAVAMGLVLCGSESWAKGPSGGGSRGPRPSTSRPSPSSKNHQTRPGTSKPGTGTSKPGTQKHGDRTSVRIRLGLGGVGGDGLVPRTTRGGDVGGDDGDAGVGDAGASQAETPETGESEPTFGMAIRELSAGTARKRGMKAGDIIMSVNGTATPDFDSLQTALGEAGSQAEVDFINVDNGKLERITLNPVSARIGATVEQVQVD